MRSLAVLFAINILNFYDRQALGAITEPIRKEFGLSDTQIGLLGTAFTLLYAVVGLPLGRMADNWSRKKLLAGGVVLWSALTASAGLAANYSMLMVSRLGVAVGEAVCAPTATSWLGDLFPPERRSRALAIFMLGVPIGGALSFLITGPVAQVWGWRFAMAIAAAPALLLVPVLLMLPEPVRGASEGRAASAAKSSPWPVLRIPTLWWIIASGALINFNLYAVATFLPAFLTRYHGLSVGESGFASGIGYGIAGVTGGLVAGLFGDRIVHRRKNGRMVMASLAALIAGPIAFAGIWQPPGSPYASLAWICLSLGFFNMYYGLVYSSIQDIVPPSLCGTTMAIYFLAMYLCGASFGPLITGNLSDRMARRAAEAAGSPAVTEAFKSAGLQQAMCVIPVLAVALALVLYAGSRTIVRDMAKRETLA